MTKENEKKERYIVQDVATQTQPVIIDTTAEEGKQQHDLHSIVARMANVLDRVEKTLTQ